MSPRKSESKTGRQLSPEQAAAAAMVAQAKERGLALTGPDGLPKLFTENVLEIAQPRLAEQHQCAGRLYLEAPSKRPRYQWR